jgi:hypothetical protein
MPFNKSQSNSRRPNSSDNSESQPQSRRPSSDRGSRRQPAEQQKKQVYMTLFSLFATEHAGERLQVDIKALEYEGRSIEDVFSLNEFLFFCEKLYYGEAKLTGSLWYKGDGNPQYSGNIRVSEDYAEEIKKEYQNSGFVEEENPKDVPTRGGVSYKVPEPTEEEEMPY